MKKMIRKSGWMGGAIATLVLLAAVAQAQTLAMVPAEVDLPIESSKPAQFEIQVSNKGNAPVAARISVTDFWYNAKNEKTFGVPGTSPRSAANWIEFVPRQLMIPAQGSAAVKVLVTPPADIAGGYYAVVFVESKPELVQAATQENGRPVFANLRLGSLILLSSRKNSTYTAEISDPSLVPPAPSRDLQLRFRFANTGNTHLFPQPRLVIMNSHHDVVAKADGETKRFLPGQKDSMEMHWGGTLPSGSYTAVLTVLYGDKVYTEDIPFNISP